MTFDKENKVSIKKIVGYLLPVFITILFLYLAFINVDLKKSFELISHASLFWLFVYVIIFYLSHFVRAVRWKVMIDPIKKNTSLLNLFGAVIIGYGVNCVIPRLGELYKGLFMGRWEGISRSTMLGTVIVERIIDIGSFALASLISVFLFPGNLLNQISWLRTSLILGFTSIFLITILVFIIVKYEQKFGAVIIQMLSRVNKKFGEKLSEVFSTLVSGLSTIQGISTVVKVFSYTIIMFIIYAFTAYIGFFMLGMEKHGSVNFIMAWIFMTISAYGVVVPTPGGTGSYHIISIFVLTQLFSFNYEISAAYALLTHFISYLVFIGSTFGLIYLINLIRSQKGLKKENFISVFNSESGKK